MYFSDYCKTFSLLQQPIIGKKLECKAIVKGFIILILVCA